MTNLIVEAAVRASVQPFAAIAVASPVRQALRIARSQWNRRSMRGTAARTRPHRDFLGFFC